MLSVFSGGTALYYAVAALCLCVGVLAAWTWGLNNAASHPNPDAPAVGAASPGQVATVSGMVDCQWGKGGTGLASGAALAAGAPISAGRRIVLESGLLEIVYRHRGEVILRGPVDYTVDSAGGGFLASGQATVRLVKLRDAATGKAVSLRPAFTIRTPASLVTNLGAESGAEACAIHRVWRGGRGAAEPNLRLSRQGRRGVARRPAKPPGDPR